MSLNPRRLVPALAGALLVALLSAASAGAATFTVENLKDSGPGSLRQAIADANAKGSMDVILFAPGLDGTLRLSSGALEVSSNIYLPGREGLTISGEGRDRIFLIRPKGDLYVERLTLTRGSSKTGGGAILNEGRLSLSSSTLKASSVIGAEGHPGEGKYTGQAGGDAVGGGILNRGNLQIQNSTLSGNLAQGGRGGDQYVRPIFECADGGVGGSALGGAIFNDGGVTTMFNSTLTGNSAWGGVGGEAGGERFSPTQCKKGATGPGRGGGVMTRGANAKTFILDSTVAGNGGSFGANLATVDGLVAVTSSILAYPNGGGANCARGGDGKIGGAGFDLESGDSCGFAAATDLRNTDPRLEPLADNGGPTLTRAIGLFSPAVDQGNSTTYADQRGREKPVLVPGVRPAAGGDGGDIGAFELQLPDSARVSPSLILFAATPVGDETERRSVTLTNRGLDPLKVGKVRIANGDAADFRIAANSCGGNRLAVGESCVVAVRFIPAAPGPRSSTVEIHSDSAESPDEVALSGFGSGRSAQR